MKKRILAVIVVICLIGSGLLLGVAHLTSGERKNLSVVEVALRNLASPIERGISVVSDKVDSFIGTFTNYSALKKENEDLRAELSEVNLKYNSLREYEAENIRLREMLGFKELYSAQYNLSAAKIIAENNTNLQHTIVIDKGSDDGIAYNMTVVNYKGLVGRVVNVLSSTSEVLLISDRQGSVGAMVYETRDTTGVVEGRGSESASLKMIHLAHDADIAVGDLIVTSGLDGVFTRGIPIGKVTSISDEADGLTKVGSIDAFVNFYSLEEVFIITDVLKERE